MENTSEKIVDQERIKIELRYGDHCSYYVDANGLLPGKWGGFEELGNSGHNGEAMFEIYYNRFRRRIPINEYGFFYGKFSCKKYDGILKLPEFNLYLCEKHGRFGLIDENEKSILHTVYKEIEPYVWGVYPGYGRGPLSMLSDYFTSIWKDEYKETLFFIVTTETGKFLFNQSKKTESLVYEDILFSNKGEIIFKSDQKYGTLDLEGNIILNPYFGYNTFGNTLCYTYGGRLFKVWTENGLLYGKIPSQLYDVCFEVGANSFVVSGSFYISKRGDKYGLISNRQKIVAEPVLDEILLYKPKDIFSEGCLHKTRYTISPDRKNINISFIIARIGEKFRLYNLQNGHLILDNCDNIKYVYSNKRDNYDRSDIIEFSEGDIKGFVLWNESIVSTTNYEDVSLIHSNILVKKDGKFGILMFSGEELFPCIYDNIQTSSIGKYTLIKDGKEEIVYTSSSKTSNYYRTYERPTYERYAGTYAQDEAGYSDDDIDTIFDGDPSAYWNID